MMKWYKRCLKTLIEINNMFTANDLAKAMSQSMDLGVRVLDVFPNMRTTPRLFKTLTNFTLAKYDKLFLVMVSPLCNMHNLQMITTFKS
jgi:hypothetical protein